MPIYRFRGKYEPDPRSLWRDIVVGADRTIDEFQTVLNRAVGLNQDHLWCFGTDQDYWDSDVQYKRPGEIAQSPDGMMRGGEAYDAGEIAGVATAGNQPTTNEGVDTELLDASTTRRTVFIWVATPTVAAVATFLIFTLLP